MLDNLTPRFFACYAWFSGPGVSVPPVFPGSTPDDPLGLLQPVIWQVRVVGSIYCSNVLGITTPVGSSAVTISILGLATSPE
jgi:hypothetical protein